MAAFDLQQRHGVFPRDMKTTFKHWPTERSAAQVSCFGQGIDGLVAMDRPLSGRTTE